MGKSTDDLIILSVVNGGNGFEVENMELNKDLSEIEGLNAAITE